MKILYGPDKCPLCRKILSALEFYEYACCTVCFKSNKKRLDIFA